MLLEEELRQELGLPHYTGRGTDLSLVDRVSLKEAIKRKYGFEISYEAELKMKTVGDMIDEAENEKGFAVLERVFYHGGD